MNNREVFTQFVRMVLSGAVSTAIAIISVHRFGHWWAGLIGVPLALLLCDIGRSMEAIRYVANTLKEAGGKSFKLKLPVGKKTFVIPDWLDTGVIIIALFVTGTFGIMSTSVVIYLIALGLEESYASIVMELGNPINVFLFGFLGYVLLECSSALERKMDTMKSFPITHSLRYFSFFRKLDIFCKKADERRNTSQSKLCEWRNQNGNLFSFKGVNEIISDLMFFAVIPSILFVSSFLMIVVLVLDVCITVLLSVSKTKSVSSALGVVFGFTTDYFLCPRDASTTTVLISLVLCSLLGGVLGWVFWQLKMKLSEMPLPAMKYAAAS